jgi:hypothetical protein
MEQDLSQSIIYSSYFDKKQFQKQLDIIKKASEEAQKKIDYASAHDENIVRAIDVVEDFLRKKHRLCYGGQAINAHLPSKYKFYDPEYSVPDYDFFSPDQAIDIKILVKDLKKAGFTEISAREGMHEGTIKIYVDFTPVADITQIDPKLYRILSSREYRYEGISYLDASTLRMLMYLELSRPRGEVERWAKVYERLSLFNEFVSFKRCLKGDTFVGNVLNSDQVTTIMNFIIDDKRIFAGADLVNFYQKSYYHNKQKTNWLVNSKKPIIFLSPDASEDAKQLKASLDSDNARDDIQIKSLESKGIDLIPSLKIIKQGNKILVYIIQQVACHSYYNIPLTDSIRKDRLLRIASMDTLISLYFSLGLVDSRYFDIGSIECLANEMVEISIKARKNPNKFPFPFVSLKCAGHQTSLSSLIRAKVQRITQRKTQRITNLDKNINNYKHNHTIKNKNKNTPTKNTRIKNTPTKNTRIKNTPTKNTRIKNTNIINNIEQQLKKAVAIKNSGDDEVLLVG